LVAEYLAGAGVEFVLDPLDVGVRQRREVCAFWEVLPDEAVCVFVEAAFPRVIRLRKVGFGTQCGDDFGVGGELFSVVVSDRFDASGERQKDASARRTTESALLSGSLASLVYLDLRSTCDMDDAFVTCADNRVGFPVADAAFLGDNGGALVRCPRGSESSHDLRFALTLVVLFTAVTQLDIKGSAVFLVFPDMLVDALVADRGGAVFHQPAADLIGAPLLLHQFFLDQFYEIWLILRGAHEAVFRFCDAFSCARLKR